MNEIDKAFVDSLVPEGSIIDGFVTVVAFSDPDGSPRWICYVDIDLPVSSAIGLLELGKLDIIARSETGLPINYARKEEDDGGS